MSGEGTWLPGPDLEPRHECTPPRGVLQGRVDDRTTSIPPGAIWRCPCGRRWVVRRRRFDLEGNAWKRRRLPWPRRTAAEKADIQYWPIDPATGVATPPDSRKVKAR